MVIFQNTSLMSRFLTILFPFFFCLAHCISAQTAEANPNLEKSLLWEISGKGIKKSYIFGTIHMIGESDFFLNESVLRSIRKSKKMVMEIDISQSMQTAMKMLMLAPMKDGKKLSDVLNESDYQLVKYYFTNESKNKELQLMPFGLIEKWKPMLLQSFLYTDMIEGAVKSYEMELLAIGTKRKMKFDGLETIEEQINIFDKIPYEDQAKELLEMIKEIKAGKNSGKAEFSKLVALYKAQDLDAMVEQSGEDLFKDMQNAEQELLINRNKKWIPKILTLSKENSVFYAVGAAHLGGKSGILRLLMKEGLKVRAILK
jgi:uncharacterized protein YbaP (TraB family)